jgi:hypothetical protein
MALHAGFNTALHAGFDIPATNTPEYRFINKKTMPSDYTRHRFLALRAYALRKSAR